jgi:hypothetical protein
LALAGRKLLFLLKAVPLIHYKYKLKWPAKATPTTSSKHVEIVIPGDDNNECDSERDQTDPSEQTSDFE